MTGALNSSTKPWPIDLIVFMNLPDLTRTKAEAKKLAADLFPGDSVALARIKPGTTFPRYHLTDSTTETLRAVFHWLYEHKPRIYKRARWHLFYDLAHRVTLIRT